MEAPLAGLSSLQQHGQSRHGVTPAVTRAGNAARSLRERRANNSAHLAEIATDGTLSELRRPGLYTKALLPDVTHENKAESVAEYACATTNVQRYSVGGKMEVIPNTFKEALTLPAKAHWSAASDKEAASLKKTTYTPSCRQPPFQLATRSSALVGCARSRLTNPTRGESSCSDGTSTRRRLRRYVCSGLQASEHPYGELFNDWGGRGYYDSVPGEVTKTAPSGDRTTCSPTWSASLS